MIRTDEIKSLFETEFGLIANKFTVNEFQVYQARVSNNTDITKAGVYVYLHPDYPNYGVVRIGVSMRNARKRALEHIDDNTGGIMTSLGTDILTKIIFLNIRDVNSIHWVVALEKFLENTLKPHVPPKRS